MTSRFRIALFFMVGLIHAWHLGAAETLDPWQLRLPLPTAFGLYDITYGQGRFVAIAPSAALVSTDGDTWQSASWDATNDFRTVTFANGEFTAMGVAYAPPGWSPFIAFSTDGLKWDTHVIKDFQFAPVALTYGNGIYTVVGSRGLCISSNGLSWTTIISRPYAGFEAVTYGNGRFVVVGRGSMVSTNGQVWTSSLTETNQMYAVAFGNDRFVATGGSGRIFTSTDGLTWVSSTLSTNYGHMADICFGQDRFVIVGFGTTPNGDGAFILNSTNALVWERSRIPRTSGLLAVAFGAGTFFGAAPGVVLTSKDGELWTGAESYRIQGIAYGKETFVASAFDQVLTSTDGVAWSDHTLTLPFMLGDASFIGNRFFALSALASYAPEATNGMATSADGTNWTVCMLWTNGTSDTKVSLPAYGRNGYVAVGTEYNWATKEYTAHSFVSADGRQWQVHAITSYLAQVTYATDRYVAIGEAGDKKGVFTSQDGVSWHLNWAGTSDPVWSQIAFGKGTFVAASMSGFLVSNPDGTWRTVRPAFDGLVYDVAYGDGLFVASGAAGTVLLSEDGHTWTPHNIGTSEWLRDVTYADGTFVVTSGMSIYQSAKTTPRLGSPQVLTSGAMQIPVHGIRSRSWEIQVSTNLRDWSSLATGTGSGEVTRVIDTNAATFRRRYYRAVITY